ncbi:MAG: LacI family DNA-binding transcriptional regulator [Solobacterium sp.]|nr:LacI family DNA-binding transcriptional regulator [Solobacterium sp.]
MNNKRVTIQDIADALGISRNTVSKAINNSEGISEATKERILKKAIEMDYKQFSYVSAMTGIDTLGVLPGSENRQKMTGEIAVLTLAYIPNNNFASMMLDRLQEELSLLGMQMIVYRVSEEHIRNRTLPRALNINRVKGLILAELFDMDYCEMISSYQIPTLMIDGPYRLKSKPLSTDLLMMDNTTEISVFVRTMIRRGLKRIGFIGDITHCKSFYERYCAYTMSMISAGIPIESKFIITPKDKDIDSLGDSLDNLDEMPDVFICVNDFVAIEVMQLLSQKDKKLPGRVRILGFDDSHESRIFYPSLSTVHIHSQSMAFSALHLLVSRIKEPRMDPRVIYVSTDLILRESTEY